MKKGMSKYILILAFFNMDCITSWPTDLHPQLHNDYQ